MTKPIELMFTIRRDVMRLPSGNWQVAVTPPALMRLPTQRVELTPMQLMGYYKWRHEGILIQEAIPDLTPNQREILMTGIGDDDFHRMFSGEEVHD